MHKSMWKKNIIMFSITFQRYPTNFSTSYHLTKKQIQLALLYLQKQENKNVRKGVMQNA